MDSVTEMFNRGMAEMRDLFIRFQKSLTTDPTIPHSVLEKFVIPPFPVNWALGQLGVLTAIDLTAHLHYVHWHMARFGDAKRDRSDSSYEPSESENDSVNSRRDHGKSKRDHDKSKLELARSKRPPSHHVFQTIKISFGGPGPQAVAGASTSGSQAVAGASTSSVNHKQGSASRKSSKSAKSSSKSKSNHGKGPNKRARN